MAATDLAAVNGLADRIHINYPEEPIVFEEKLRLFPQGCFTLENRPSEIAGYCFSHPWVKGMPPQLDRLLGTLPASPTTYFVHDLALDERVRGKGLAAALIPTLVAVASLFRIPHMTLIAVNKSEGFWEKAGFGRTQDAALQQAVRAKYSDEAIHMELTVAL
jgi:GNAT superfamily N-acetyltransferase